MTATVHAAAAIEKKFVRTTYGEVAYLETGRAGAPPVLFVHGIPTSSFLWRHVLRFLQDDFHCFAPDLMGLGDTRVDPGATHGYSWEAQAEMLLETMQALGHDRFAVVCHDQGGAAAQILAARLPDHVTALVLTDCVAYDNWPVPAIAQLQRLARLGPLGELLGQPRLMEWIETHPRFSRFKKGVFDPKKLTDDVIREYLRPMRSREGRESFRQFLLAGHPSFTELALPGLKRFEKPTLVIWAADDHYLSPSWGRRLKDDIPGATRFELVPFCGHFWQEERPSEFASIMREFLTEHLGEGAGKGTGKKRRKLPVVERTEG